jgi:hypothetical protein
MEQILERTAPRVPSEVAPEISQLTVSADEAGLATSPVQLLP